MLEMLTGLLRAYKVYDQAEEMLRKKAGIDACVRGCGKCCEVNTPQMMGVEALNAVSILASLGKLTQVVEVAEGWLEEPGGCQVYTGKPFGLLPPQLIQEWNMLATQQCPFLLPTKDCMLHTARGLVCRSYGVFRAPAYFCKRPVGKGETLTQRTAIQPTPEFVADLKDFKAYCLEKNPALGRSGFLPTMIVRAAKPEYFQKKAHENVWPSAKLIGHDEELDLLWDTKEFLAEVSIADRNRPVKANK